MVTKVVQWTETMFFKLATFACIHRVDFKFLKSLMNILHHWRETCMNYTRTPTFFCFVGTGEDACVLVGSFLLPTRAAGSAQAGLLQAARAGPRRKHRAVRLPNWNHIQRQGPCASITFNLLPFLEICQEILGPSCKFCCWLYPWSAEWYKIN